MKNLAAAIYCLLMILVPVRAAAEPVATDQVTPMQRAMTVGADGKAIPLQYAMTVDANGKATNLKAIQDLPETIDQWIRKRVSSYIFEPAKINGQTQSATTTLYLTLGPIGGLEAKGGYRITSLSTGPRLVRGQIPSYFNGTGAGYFVVTFDKEGRVTRAELDQPGTLIGGGAFRKWGLALAKSFRLEPETVAGVGVPGQARIPLVHCSGGNCPQLPPKRAEDGSDLGGELVAKSVLKAPAPDI